MGDAPQTLAQITNGLSQNFRGEVVRTANRRSNILRFLRIEQGEGKNVAVDVEYDGMVTEDFADGDDVANFGSDAIAPATLPWGKVRSNYRIGVEAIAAARTSRSPNGLINLLMRNFVNGATKWASVVNGKMFSSVSGIIGLDFALRDDNTYMGIDRTNVANTNFRGNLIDPGGLIDPTLKLLRDDITVTIYKACGKTPELALCSPEVFSKVGSLFTEMRRLNQDVQVSTPRGEITLDGSLGAIVFEGCVFLKDKDATSNRIYYLSTEDCYIEYLPLSQPSGMIGEMAVDQTADDGYGPIPLGLHCIELGRTGASRKFSTMGALQLVVQRPNACGMRVNVKTT